MASPKMLAQRAELARLQPRAFQIPTPRPEPVHRIAVGPEMRRRAYLRNLQGRRRVLALNEARAIPVSGAGRRRAKAIRNREAVLGPVG